MEHGSLTSKVSNIFQKRRQLLILFTQGFLNYNMLFSWKKVVIADTHRNVVLIVWVEALRPSKQFFSQVGMEPPLPWYYQYFLGGKCILLKDTTQRPE